MKQYCTIVRLFIFWVSLLTSFITVTSALGQGYVDDGKRYLMYTLYHYDNDGNTQQRQIEGMEHAFANGMNSVVIGIAWGKLQPSLNSAPDWEYVDRFVRVAQQHKAKIAIRLNTCRRDRVGFWPEEQSMKDMRGNIMLQDGVSHVRFGYVPGIDKVQDFVRSVAQRYKYLNDSGELLFMSVTFNPQWENEYWFSNNPDQSQTSYDFNELTINDFQQWVATKYNGSLETINRTWGTSYKTMSEIRPTYPITGNQGGYQGKRGVDWYIFRHNQLKSFTDRFARTVKSVDPSIRVVTEQGSVYDLGSANRGTLGFKNMAELMDGVKVNDGPGYIYQFSMDLLRSNVKPGGWVINEVDGMFYRDPSTTAALASQIETSFKFGAKIITFANYFLNYNQETQLKQLLDGVKQKRLLEQPVPTITPVGTVTYRLSSVLQSNIYEDGVFGRWATMREGGAEKPVRVLIDEDILSGSTTPPQNQPPTVANQVADQTAVVDKGFSFRIPDNTFTDADGQITGVTVSGLPAGLNYNSATRTITGTATLIGSNEVTVTATDNSNATATDRFMLSVRRATLPLQLLDPTLDCASGRFEFRSTEGDGSTVEYSIDDLYSWNTQTTYTLEGKYRVNTKLAIRARQSGTEFSLTYTTTCPAAGNRPPVVSESISDQGGTVGKAFLIIIPTTTFSDPDGTIASINLTGLPPGINYNTQTRVLEGTATSVGNWTVTATATDNGGATVSTSFVMRIITAPTTQTLRLLSPVIDCVTGQFEFRSADGDGTAIEYAADDLYSWNTRTTYTLVDWLRYGSRLTIRARQSGVDYVLLYTTVCPIVNKAPIVNMGLPNQTHTVDKPVSESIPAGTFTDTDGTIASVAVTGLPAGLNYNSTTRLITGTVSTTGTWTVTVTATDNEGATGSTTFTITISREVKPLRILEPVLNCETGLFEFRYADGDGSAVEYSIDRLIPWTSASSFTLALNMRRDTQLDIKLKQNGLVVAGVFYPKCPDPNKLPTVKAAIPNQALTQNKAMSLTIPADTFEDSDGKIDWISVTGLPPGIMYGANTQTLSGAPTEVGSWTVTIMATDNRGGTVSTTFVITVKAEAKPLRLLAPLVDCNTGRLEFRTADGDGTVIGYSIDRVLNWTNQSAYTMADGVRYGTSMVLRVRQSGKEQSLTYSTPCVRQNKPPVVASPIANQVLIVNQPASFSLPAGTFTDSDGTIASVTLTGLPVGLSYDPLKRVIRGTPTLIGTSPAIARATDNMGASVSDTFLITVRVAPRFAVTTTLLDMQGKLIKELVDTDILDSKRMPVLANLSCQPKVAAGSVQMELTGKAKRTVYANAAPYLLYPSGQGFRPDVGSYQLKVSVYSGANGTGNLLGVTNVRFDIIIANEGGSAPPQNTTGK